MVTEDYQGGLYDWCGYLIQARAAPARTKINPSNTSGLGSLRRSFQTKKLIDDPPNDKQTAGQKLEGEPRVLLDGRDSRTIRGSDASGFGPVWSLPMNGLG
jgi:hypothetical protein